MPGFVWTTRWYLAASVTEVWDALCYPEGWWPRWWFYASWVSWLANGEAGVVRHLAGSSP